MPSLVVSALYITHPGTPDVFFATPVFTITRNSFLIIKINYIIKIHLLLYCVHTHNMYFKCSLPAVKCLLHFEIFSEILTIADILLGILRDEGFFF